jgi:hypothetical protein
MCFQITEKRLAARKQVFAFGTLTDDSYWHRLTVVKNISRIGALLALENTVEIPNEFTLTIDDISLHRSCIVVWENAKQIGVRFSKPLRDVEVEWNDERNSSRRDQKIVGPIRADGGFGTKQSMGRPALQTGTHLSLSYTVRLLFSNNDPRRPIGRGWRRLRRWASVRLLTQGAGSMWSIRVMIESSG